MSILDNPQFAYAYKIRYPKGIPWTIYRDQNAPFMMMVDKDPKATGESMIVPVEYSSATGRSSNIDKARANQSPQKGKRFNLDWARDYAIVSVDRLTMKASESNEGAIVSAWSRSMKHGEDRLRRSIAAGLAGDGSGAVGQILSISGTTITFASNASSVQLEVDDILQANPNKTGNGGTMRAGTGRVTSIDRQTGVLTFTAVGGWAPQNNDWLYIDGDYDQKMKGIQAWIPFTKPVSGDNFGGVDRSVDPVRLAGIRVDSSAAAGIIDAIQSGMGIIRREGALPSHIFCSMEDFNIAVKEAESRRIVIEEVVTEYEVGVRAIRIGTALLFGDMYFPDGYAYPLNLESWTFESVDDAPHIIDDDGLDKRRTQSGDGFGSEWAYYGNLKCEEPGTNAVIKLPTVR